MKVVKWIACIVVILVGIAFFSSLIWLVIRLMGFLGWIK